MRRPAAIPVLPALTRALLVLALPALASRGAGAERPRLAVVVVASGLRPEALSAWEDAAAPGEGLARLTRGGLRFLNVRIDHAVTTSGPGHATLSTGAAPSGHGIVLDGWFGGTIPRLVSCTETPGAALVVPGTTVPAGGPLAGVGPSLLEASTVADELVAATDGRSKAWSIGEEPSGAVLTAGRLGKALWLSPEYGVASSTAYFPRRGAFPPRLPRWVEEIAAGPSFPSRSAMDRVADLAVAAIREEALGVDDAPDLLWVSLSLDVPATSPRAPSPEGGASPGAAGASAQPRGAGVPPAEAPGTSAPALVGLERAVSRLLVALDSLGGGPGDRPFVLFLVADRGSPAAREDLAERGFPVTTLDPESLAASVKTALDRAIRPLDWVLGARPGAIWLNTRAIEASRRSAEEVETEAAGALRGTDGVLEVWTRSRVARGKLPDTETGRRVRHSFHPDRFPSLLIVPRPYSVWRGDGGRLVSASPHAYDTQVPLVVYGPGIEPAGISRRVSLADIAPTLAVLLGAGLPSACEGEPLGEALEGRP